MFFNTNSNLFYRMENLNILENFKLIDFFSFFFTMKFKYLIRNELVGHVGRNRCVSHLKFFHKCFGKMI